MNTRPSLCCRSCTGFTMVELSVVLVIIGVILGAVSLGGDVLRSAQGQRIYSEFVSGWANSYSSYTNLKHIVPGDDPLNPTYVIKSPSGGKILCNDAGALDLTNAFFTQGITVPAGWTPGQEDRFVYQDSNGSPHELRVCLLTTFWAVPGLESGLYVQEKKHVMQLTGLTVELAMQLDTLIDGRQDQRFGRFRSIARAADTQTGIKGVDWPPVKTVAGEANIAEVDAYLELN